MRRAPVVKRPRILAGWVEPSLDHFENEEVAAIHQSRVDDTTLQVGVALGD
jgi:hypothetical protein